MKIKPYPQTTMEGLVTYDNPFPLHSLEGYSGATGHLGIRIGSDGRIWICFNGMSILRFKPMTEFLEVESEEDQIKKV